MGSDQGMTRRVRRSSRKSGLRAAEADTRVPDATVMPRASRRKTEGERPRTSRTGPTTPLQVLRPRLPESRSDAPPRLSPAPHRGAATRPRGSQRDSLPEELTHGRTVPALRRSSRSLGMSRVEIEIGPFGVPDNLPQRLSRPDGQDPIDLILHLLQPVEVLCGRGRRLPAGPLGRLVNHDPRMRERPVDGRAGGLQHDGAHRIGHSLDHDGDSESGDRRCERIAS